MSRLRRVLAAIILALVWTLSSAQSVNPRTYIPENAPKYFDTISDELDRLMPDFPYRHYIPAKIEVESCLHLRHRRCFDATSELRTNREQGVGLAMITRTWHPDGRLRGDTLADLKRQYQSELKDLTWENIKVKPELQIRAGILLVRNLWNALRIIPDTWQRLAMTSAAYNGGKGGLDKERMACSLKKGCNPDIWFGHVENIVLKSTTAGVGGRSFWQINRDHPKEILLVRMPKYQRYFIKTKPDLNPSFKMDRVDFNQFSRR